MADEPIYLSTAQLAKRWGMSPGTLRTWRSRGIGPEYFAPNGTPGGRKKYKVADIEAWEQANMRGDHERDQQRADDAGRGNGVGTAAAPSGE